MKLIDLFLGIILWLIDRKTISLPRIRIFYLEVIEDNKYE